MIDIKNYEGLYQLSNDFRVYSLPRPKTKGGFLKPSISRDGYLKVTLSKNGKLETKRLNRLVYETFIGPIPTGYDVHHINEDKQDNRPENLCLLLKGEHYKIHKSKSVMQFTKDGEFVAEYPSIREASIITGLSYGNISNCCCNRKYCHTLGGYVFRFKYADEVAYS